jgi:hypothetical protein
LTQHLTPSETINTFFTGFQASVGKLGSQLLVEPRTLFQAPETQGIEAKAEKKAEIILSEQKAETQGIEAKGEKKEEIILSEQKDAIILSNVMPQKEKTSRGGNNSTPTVQRKVVPKI